MSLFCRVFGHKESKLEPDRGVASAWQCERCGHFEKGIEWPRHDNSDLRALLEIATKKANDISA
jgi:hypothetical protein